MVEGPVAAQRDEASIGKEGSSAAERIGTDSKASHTPRLGIVDGRVRFAAVGKEEFAAVLNLVEEHDAAVKKEGGMHCRNTGIASQGDGLVTRSQTQREEKDAEKIHHVA